MTVDEYIGWFRSRPNYTYRLSFWINISCSSNDNSLVEPVYAYVKAF